MCPLAYINLLLTLDAHNFVIADICPALKG